VNINLTAYEIACVLPAITQERQHLQEIQDNIADLASEGCTAAECAADLATLNTAYTKLTAQWDVLCPGKQKTPLQMALYKWRLKLQFSK